MNNSVRIVFIRHRNISSLLLRTFQWSAWSHVAIVDGDEVIEATAWHGVSVRSLSDLLADSSHHEFIDVPSANPKAVIAAARSQIGKPYDWFGVVGFVFRRKWENSSRWFCSKLVAGAFDLAGEPLFRVKVWRITPRDLYIPIWRFCTN